MSGFDRCWLTCVFLLSVGYASWAAKLQNSYDICKLFEPPGANLRHEAVLMGSNPRFELVYLGADPTDVVQSIKEGIAVNIHP